ncbi:tyrosine-type recombinase/integrase [Microbacterium sp. UBA837]|uniref:tyrosine-type recombinase/integrase n=1 Tax=Microbacterium sp. UBA837 TaxID=1946956 RepID=UPI0025EAAC20|nr:tyrosine-type recombinase/integrase [Microbacterium sp. UBA837]
MNNDNEALRGQTNVHPSNNITTARRADIGRPRLAVGELGKIDLKQTESRFHARGSTRDTAGKLRRISATGATAKEAVTALRKRAAQLGLIPGELSGASTLGELLDVWLSEVVESRNIRPQTVAAYRTKANRLKREFGALEIAELRPRRMQIVMNDLAKHKTASEFQAMRTVLKQAFRYAVRAELLSANPLDSLEPVRPAEQGPPVALNVEQVQAFRRAFAEYVEEGVRDSNRRKAQLAVDIILGLGGLRISEALALRHRDVDFENCTASVNGTLVYLPHEPLQRQDKLKRDGQSRIVRLAPGGVGMRALRAALEQCSPDEREPDQPLLRRVETGGVDEPWINPAVISFHFDIVSKRTSVVEALATTGLTSEQLTPHTLRRSVATVVSRGLGLEQASALLGRVDQV